MKLAGVNDVSLESVEHWLLEFIQPVTFEIIKERDAKLLLVRPFDEPEIRTQDSLLLRLQVVEQV